MGSCVGEELSPAPKSLTPRGLQEPGQQGAEVESEWSEFAGKLAETKIKSVNTLR